MHIAIDAMGGDGGVDLTVPASLQASLKFPELSLTLVGNEELIAPHLADTTAAVTERLSVLHTPQQISDEDKPGNVLRSARQSSMYLATELVKRGEVKAMVSAGNTGALLMIGRHLLKTITGIQKPAMVASIPGATRQGYLLDVGANPECDAQQLFEFAVMGSVLAESLNGTAASVGLLNIGAEYYKGTEEVRQASKQMGECSALNYIGFIEANELFEGVADVTVCDGFVGNVTVKSSAGVANVVNKFLAEQLPGTSSDTVANDVLTRLAAQINPQRFNGASLLGLQGSIVKSHGNATVEGFTYAIQQAVREVENAVPQLIAKKVAAIIEAN
ncbi:MAG: phosphate acyltransferase PlsX [Gammaproteobacteria bacterium]|jgi:glycerol-3-phosphate acyltransferase PlsX|nr:phosphate acyltransferase PlsX [Gammaproteobacteria bacterium]MDP6732312.1 phosphate acyltransferase PlsX [Gammaproteobacteria bacterium]